MIGTSRNGLAIAEQFAACGETESLDRIILGPSGCWLCNSRVCFVAMLRSTVIAEKEETVGPRVAGCTDAEQMHPVGQSVKLPVLDVSGLRQVSGTKTRSKCSPMTFKSVNLNYP